MSNCSSIDRFVTPYVDGELREADRLLVDEHLQRCDPCRSRVAWESSVRRLVRSNRGSLTADRAPASLYVTCREILTADGRRAVAGSAGTPRVAPRVWGALRPARWAPVALATSLFLLVAGTVVYQATRYSSRVLAAELAADHVKCFAANRLLGTRHDRTVVEASMHSMFDWRLQLPAEFDTAGLELIGSRLCLYGEGRVAHLMYRDHGEPVSIFMLPGRVRSEELVEALGHEAAIWPSGDRTFVLVTRGSRDEVERLASFAKAALK
jgi:anti-sigma factor RsiW